MVFACYISEDKKIKKKSNHTPENKSLCYIAAGNYFSADFVSGNSG